MRKWLTTRRQLLLVGAGVLLVLMSAPAGALANGGTRVVAPNNSATRTITPSHASNSGFCGSDIADFNPDPVLGAAFTKYANDAATATTPPNLPAGTLGITSTSATTGSPTNPVPAGAFAAGYLDETQLNEYPDPQAVTDDTKVGLYSHEPVGTVIHLDGTSTTGQGMPYAAVYDTSLSTPLVTDIPVKVLSESYTVNPGGFLQTAKPGSSCNEYYAVVSFDVTPYIGHQLATGHTYAAYILMRDSDHSGPLTNHVWYFQAAPNIPQPGTITVHVYQVGTTTEVPGGQTTLDSPPGIRAQTDTPTGSVFGNLPPDSYTAGASAPPGGWVFVPSSPSTYNITNGGNSATMSSPIVLPPGGTGTAIFFVTKPQFQLTKTVSPTGTVPVGTSLHYTVTIKNTGTIAADPGPTTDTLSTSGGATYTVTGGPAVTAGTFSGVDPTWTWNVGTLQPGESEMFSLTVQATHDGTITNTAFNTHTNCPLPDVPDCTPSNPVVSFQLSKSVTPTGTVPVGTTLTYTVTIKNLSASVSGDPGPTTDTITTSGGATYTVTGGPTPSKGTVTGTNPTWTWSVGTLAPGESETLTLALKATATGTITNTAFNTNTNCAQPNNPTCTPSNPIADFQLSKTVTPTGTVPVGTTLTYTVTITNVSTTVAADPGPTTDTITTSGGATYTVTGGPTASKGSVSGTNPTWTWNVGMLQPGESETLTLVIKATHDGTITNTAFNTNTNCPTAGMNGCTPVNQIVSPNLTLNKTVDKTTAALGDTLTYTVTVANNGTGDATNVLIDDLFGGTAGLIVNDGTNGTSNSFSGSPVVTVTKLSDGHYQWTYSVLHPGDVASLSFTAEILAPGNITNPAGSGSVVLTNTASTAGPPPVTVSTTAPWTGGTQGITSAPTPGGVQGITTSTPTTGAVGINFQVAGFLLLGGLGLILMGMLLRKPEEDLA